MKRVGRSDAYASEFDLEADEYVPVPKGDVHKKKEIVQDVTLHDLGRISDSYTIALYYLIYLHRYLKCSTSRRPRHPLDDGTNGQAEENGNHREIAIRN